MAFLCFWLAFCGLLPGIGQIALWLFGHPIIRAILWLFHVQDMSRDTPPAVNGLMVRWNSLPIRSTLVEFLFWSTLIISIELSLSGVVGWLRRWAYKNSTNQAERK